MEVFIIASPRGCGGDVLCRAIDSVVQCDTAGGWRRSWLSGPHRAPSRERVLPTFPRL